MIVVILRQRFGLKCSPRNLLSTDHQTIRAWNAIMRMPNISWRLASCYFSFRKAFSQCAHLYATWSVWRFQSVRCSRNLYRGHKLQFSSQSLASRLPHCTRHADPHGDHLVACGACVNVTTQEKTAFHWRFQFLCCALPKASVRINVHFNGFISRVWHNRNPVSETSYFSSRYFEFLGNCTCKQT